MATTPNLDLPYLIAAQTQKHVTHNEALRRLDAIVQIAVLDRDLAAAPASPTEGARYIVAAGASGAWAGQVGRIAAWQDGAWAFYPPKEGWLAWVADEDQLLAFDGAAWQAAAGGAGTGVASFEGRTGPVVSAAGDYTAAEIAAAPAGGLQATSVQAALEELETDKAPLASPAFTGAPTTPQLGINAAADATNRLSVAAAATLFTHAGAGHQVKVNKAAATATASFLFQTNFSGRAELGTSGDDDFHLKVSPDGLAWSEAIVIDKATGLVTLANKSVGNAALADMPAGRLKGRATAGSGAPEDLTSAQATALLDPVVGDAGAGGTKGLVPAPAAGDAAAGRFLKADGTWAAPAAGGSAPGGATGLIQFNDAGAFGGAVGIGYDKVTQKVTLTAAETLFNHNGAGRQAALNKSAAGDTASIVFQTGFSGRAELGTTGDDDFHLKVSADGSVWNEAWIVNRATGEVSVRKTLALEDQTATPSTPTSGLKLWSKSVAGRRLPFVTDPNGNSCPLQASLWRSKRFEWIASGNGTGLATIGFGNSVTGTATARNVATTNLFTAARRLGYVSAATAGSSAGTRHALAQFFRGNGTAGIGGFLYACRFGISDAAAVPDARLFVGLHSATAVIGSVNPSTLTNIIGVGTDNGQTTLRILTNDASGTATAVDLGANFPANTLSTDLYELVLFCPPNASGVGYRVERLNTGHVAEGTLATDLPASTTLLSPQVWRNNGASALAVGIDVVSQYLETSV